MSFSSIHGLRLKLVCPLGFTILLLHVLAVPLRNKRKHMCKTNHSLSSQICHELTDQREMREATFQTGPQGSSNQTSLSGAGKDGPAKSALAPKAPARPSTSALIVTERKQIQPVMPGVAVGNNAPDTPSPARRHLFQTTGRQIDCTSRVGTVSLTFWMRGWPALTS